MSERSKLLLKLAKEKLTDSATENNQNYWKTVPLTVASDAEIRDFENDKENLCPQNIAIDEKGIDHTEPENENISYEYHSDDSVKDPDYAESDNSKNSSSEDELLDANSNEVINHGEQEKETEGLIKKGKKRKRNESNWIKNVNKKLRNTGQAYRSSSKSGKLYERRCVKMPCNEKCKLKCTIKISEEQRQKIFTDYWSLGDIEKQKDFIKSSMKAVTPKYRYTKEGGSRQPNNAFYFSINGQQIRTCKLFFKATLDINDRPIRTVLKKQTFFTGNMISEDKRGKHGKHHTVPMDIKQGIRHHIDSIPRIESHYTRSHTTRQFIDGSKSLAELHRDYVVQSQNSSKPFGNYFMYHRIFNDEYNISFFAPKKDQCELCVAFENAKSEEKEELRTKYEDHLLQKDLSGVEKERDKSRVSENYVVTCYDLQQVLPCPNGNVSVFYYASKLNVFNFTLFELKKNSVQCFVWHEGEALRGANEIGTSVLKYIQDKANVSDKDNPLDIVFYSDNCCGQQKNRFLIAMYMYAVMHYNVSSITHKFLISGHTQNENDSCHSVIEQYIRRNKKSGPIYTPDQYFTLIRSAKRKGEPYKVTELSHEDIIDLKDLAQRLNVNILKNDENENIKISDFRILKVDKGFPFRIFYKTGYDQESFKEITCKRSNRKADGGDSSLVDLRRAYKQKPTISEKKKLGLLTLLEKSHIPKTYSNFYKNL